MLSCNDEKELIVGDKYYNKTIELCSVGNKDTIYYNKDCYEMEINNLTVWGDSISETGIGIRLDNNSYMHDTILKLNDKVLARASYYPTSKHCLKKMEFYEWFSLEQIDINNKKGYVITKTGTNPNKYTGCFWISDPSLDGFLLLYIK